MPVLWPQVKSVRIALISVLVAFGCGPAPTKAEPEGKARLNKLLRLYQAYVRQNKTGPPDEAALREFGQKMSPQERDAATIGDDLESIFISSRDGQKYVVTYGLKLDPGGKMRFVAWEAVGQNGRRFVALSNGYVEEYSDEAFQRDRQ
jgi:hypothetical protein